MTAKITVTGALGADEEKRIPADAELIERIEALPWGEPERSSATIARLAWCHVADVPLSSPMGPRGVDVGFPLGWLWVNFKIESGHIAPDVYVYEDVPRSVYSAVQQAKSPGSAHARLIRGHYRYAGARIGTGHTFIEADGIA